jgi:hypothetical protein
VDSPNIDRLAGSIQGPHRADTATGRAFPEGLAARLHSFSFVESHIVEATSHITKPHLGDAEVRCVRSLLFKTLWC